MKRHRSVLSRLERVRLLQEKGELDLEKRSILGLPKVRHLRIRVRKEKAAAPAAGETAAAGTAAGAAAPAATASGKATAAKTPATAKAPGAQTKPEAGAPAKKKE